MSVFSWINECFLCKDGSLPMATTKDSCNQYGHITNLERHVHKDFFENYFDKNKYNEHTSLVSTDNHWDMFIVIQITKKHISDAPNLWWYWSGTCDKFKKHTTKILRRTHPLVAKGKSSGWRSDFLPLIGNDDKEYINPRRKKLKKDNFPLLFENMEKWCHKLLPNWSNKYEDYVLNIKPRSAFGKQFPALVGKWICNTSTWTPWSYWRISEIKRI